MEADRGHRAALPRPEGRGGGGVEAVSFLEPREAVPAGEGGVAAELPGQGPGEARKGVEDGPGDDHVVVDDDQEGDDQHAVAETFEGRGHPAEDLEGPLAGVLTQG